jgi:hypothetical protein
MKSGGIMIRPNQVRSVLAVVVGLAMMTLSVPAFSSDALKPLPKSQVQLKPVKPQVPTEVEATTTKAKDFMRKGVPDLISPNPSIGISSENPTNAAGPFVGDCLCCYKEGYMPMKTATCYVRNVGSGPSTPCLAKLTWVDRNNVPQEVTVEIPALNPFSNEAINESQKLVLVEFPAVQYFSIDHPVTLIIDPDNQVPEAREDNNTVSFVWSDFYASRMYQFNDCQ